MIFDRYIFRMLLVATIITAMTLAGVILLTQSLRFLELVIESSASSFIFWKLTMLALPRFFEIILPIALMAASLFVYNRMLADSEIIALRAAGLSPMKLVRPALVLAGMVTLSLMLITMWVAPLSLDGMHKMRQEIKAQYSTLLFREEVFNNIGKDLTVYISKRGKDGELEGLMIHDSRKELDYPVTIIAKKGVIVDTDEGHQVLVYDGSRQEFNDKTKTLNRLDFNRYTIDLPESGPVRQRWREPEERTFTELLNPNPDVKRDMENLREFAVEQHKRIITPFLAITFTIVSLAFLVVGPVKRKGYNARILGAILSVVILQGLYLGAFNMAVHSNWGLVFMYGIVITPLAFGFLVFSSYLEKLRHRFLHGCAFSNKRVASE